SVDLHVIFASNAGARPYFDRDFNHRVSWDSDLLDGFSYEFLPGADGVDPSTPLRNKHLLPRLAALDPAAVLIYGFHHPISQTTLLWARANRRGVLYCADSELRSPRTSSVRL